MNTKRVLAIVVIVAAIGMASTVAIGSLTDRQAFAKKGEASDHISDEGSTHQSCKGTLHSSGGYVICL